MPYYQRTVLPQLRPVAHVSSRQPQLQHLSKCQDLLTVVVSESNGDMIQQSLSSQQQCLRASSSNADDNVAAAASAQKCHSQLHHMSVSYLVKECLTCDVFLSYVTLSAAIMFVFWLRTLTKVFLDELLEMTVYTVAYYVGTFLFLISFRCLFYVFYKLLCELNWVIDWYKVSLIY